MYLNKTYQNILHCDLDFPKRPAVIVILFLYIYVIIIYVNHQLKFTYI